PIDSDNRPPWNTRVRMSRPYWSVPNGNRADGGLKRERMLIAVGSMPVSIGPMIAQSTRMVTSTSPILNERCAASLRNTRKRRRSARTCVEPCVGPVTSTTSVIAHPRINQGIDDIDGDVDQHEGKAE